MSKEKLPYQGYDGIYLRNKWLEREKAISRAKSLQSDILKPTQNYHVIYEKIDELKSIYDRYGDLYGDSDVEWLKGQLIKTLTKEYENRIKKEFAKRVDNAKLYYTIYDYKSSKYHGTYEEYAESRAIESLLEETSRYRYGGYMHVVIMNILTPEYRATKRHGITEQSAAIAKQKTIAQRKQERTQAMIEEIRRKFDIDYHKDR